ncbi:MAG: NADH-quinone oxidoreductase subunit C [Chromatiaceae bacterium]
MSHQESRTGDARQDALVDAIDRHFAGSNYHLEFSRGEMTLVTQAEAWHEQALILRDHPDFLFEQLTDVCGVDFAAYGQSEWETEAASSTGFGRGAERSEVLAADDAKRFASVYHLLSMSHNRRLRIRVQLVGPQPMVDSVVDIWSVANWFEREAFDLFGILYRGHPDLRRILTDYGFVGHPFRKDFPVSGHVEMRYDAEQQRVIYQPVTIEPREVVPRIVREQHYADSE